MIIPNRIALLAASLLFHSFVHGQSSPKPVLSSASAPRLLADVVDQANRSAVRVIATFTAQVRASNQTIQAVGYFAEGTGFILNAQAQIVTAAHVVSLEANRENFEKALIAKQLTLVPGSFRITEVEVSVPPLNLERDEHGNEFSNIMTSHRAEIVKEDSVLDVALLAGDIGLLTRPDILVDGRNPIPLRIVPSFQQIAPRPGDSISVSGFPAVLGFSEGISSLVTNGGIVSSASFRDERGRWVYLADIHVNHGDSGGPVFNNATGEVIGFVDAYYPATNGENSGLTVIIPIREILESLKGNNKVVASR